MELTMRIILLFLLTTAVFFGCMGAPKQSAVKQESAKAQQIKADQAQAEMERDIAAGTPSLTEPPANAPAAQKPSAVLPPASKPLKLGSLKPETKYPMKDGYPVWFYTPVYDGYVGAVGIAPKQPRGGISAQKRVARMQAQKNLAKQIEVLVKSEVNVETTAADYSTVEYYREKVTSLTKEQADQFLSGFKVMDEWVDEKTGEYYMWMILER